VLIATFGLRGTSSHNMITGRAIPCTKLIHAVLKTELGVSNQIGGTIGKAYCGVVGGIFRHEYAILGPSVNLAARLMSLPNHPGILVDDAVKSKAGNSANFRSLEAVKAKGYNHLVPIFEPLTAEEKRWGAVNPHFVGRRREVEMFCNVAKEMVFGQYPARMFFLTGLAGSGKSSVVVQITALVIKCAAQAQKDIIITKNVSNEGDSLVPFSLFRSIFRDILFDLKMRTDDASSRADSSNNSSLHGFCALDDLDWDKMSTSVASTRNADTILLMDHLKYLCKEINAPRGISEIIGHHLFGLSNEIDASQGATAGGPDEIVNFMAKAFLRCTCHADLTVLAMNDVYKMDIMSWKVVRKLFETSNNLLIFCSSRPFNSYKLSIEDNFWSALIGQYKKGKRFISTDLKPLEQCDIAEMMAKCLDCDPRDIDGILSKDVFVQSRGMPYFASEIIKNIKKKSMHKRLKNGKVGWRQTCINNSELPSSDASIIFASVDDLILHRIDELGDNIREVLCVAAVLGTTFDLLELRTVYVELFHIPISDRDRATKRICHTLKLALKENILRESFDLKNADNLGHSLDDSHNDPQTSNMSLEQNHEESFVIENRQYRFYHDTWKRNIMALLLDSRKRDIHRHAAKALETRYVTEERHDYRSKIQIFRHWKESGSNLQATELALEIGKSLVSLGLNNDCIRIYNDALDMWKRDLKDDESLVCGFSHDIIVSLDAINVKCMVRLLVAKGQAFGNLVEGKQSAEAFRSALKILRMAPASNELKDRSFVFPIFSGLHFLLKFGGTVVEPQHEIAYEKELVANFVYETQRDGNPIHYARALAMEIDFNCRLGNWEWALLSHAKLNRVYKAEEHSVLMCKIYSSDRAAQTFSYCATCYNHLGNINKALEVANHIVEYLMPKMDITNIHNSVIMLYPILWIMKDNGLVVQGRNAFRKYILQAFHEHVYCKTGGSTFCYPLFKPIEVLLDLFINEVSIKTVKEYIDWIRNEKSFASIPGSLNRAMSKFGRCADSIFAEIFLLIAKHSKDNEVRKELIGKGIKHSCTALKHAEGLDESTMLHSAFDQAESVYDKLRLEHVKSKKDDN